MSGSLYVVSTPIGNLDDLSRRALEVLGQVDWVAAEDTRHSQTLLNHLGIKARLISCHDHNEAERSPELVVRLRDGESGALISDAGTPLVSDPGYRLVRACQDAGVAVVPVPGASALLAALAVSGQPSDRFLFEGFVPSKGAARENALRRLAGLEVTSVIFEAPHRVVSLLESLAGLVDADRELTLCRELTKRFEIGRMRVLSKGLYNCNSWHRDPEPRLHIPVVSNPGSLFVVNNHVTHLPADGSVYFTDTRGYHMAMNGGEHRRVTIAQVESEAELRLGESPTPAHGCTDLGFGGETDIDRIAVGVLVGDQIVQAHQRVRRSHRGQRRCRIGFEIGVDVGAAEGDDQ